jgi:hypothetical protein
MFKAGDKVRFIRGEIIEWELDEWWRKDDLEIDKEYIIESVSDNDGISLRGKLYWHHPAHFVLKGTKEYKVRLSQDDLDAIFLSSSLIGGNPNTTSRSVFSNVEVNHIIGLHSSFLQQGYNYNFLSKYRTGNIDFIKKVY